MGNCCGPRKKEDESQTSTTTSSLKPTQNSTHSSTPLSPSVPSPVEKFKPVSLPTPRSEEDILSSPHLKAFTYNELKNATRNFRNDSLLGEGGFGCVYKGWIDVQTLGPARPGFRMIVAVKKLKPEGFQGHKEWLSEVTYLGQFHHPNLVKLIGYCLEGDNRLLVYEYMPKGSLENHLFRRGAQPLNWAIRIKVAIGAARGLSFLHESEQQVIYRDFKASNILLDSEYNAKLSDFGLAKAGPTGDRSHVSTQVLGTQGYAAPEYLATGRLTSRCDVYSFGVVLLELLSGRRAVDKSKVGLEIHLVDWARPYLCDKRKLYRIMDVKLEGQYPRKGAFMVAVLASECTGDAKRRPSMTEVIDRLDKVPLPKEVTIPQRNSSPSPSQSPNPSLSPKSPLRPNSTLRGIRTPRGASPLGAPKTPPPPQHLALRSTEK